LKNLTKLLEDMARAASRANLTSGECQTCSEYCCTRLAREGGQGGGGREGRREREGGGREGRRERRREREGGRRGGGRERKGGGRERKGGGRERKGGGRIGEVEERGRKEEGNVLVIIT